jgi:hypothetical protein
MVQKTLYLDSASELNNWLRHCRELRGLFDLSIDSQETTVLSRSPIYLIVNF